MCGPTIKILEVGIKMAGKSNLRKIAQAFNILNDLLVTILESECISLFSFEAMVSWTKNI